MVGTDGGAAPRDETGWDNLARAELVGLRFVPCLARIAQSWWGIGCLARADRVRDRSREVFVSGKRKPHAMSWRADNLARAELVGLR